MSTLIIVRSFYLSTNTFHLIGGLSLFVAGVSLCSIIPLAIKKNCFKPRPITIRKLNKQEYAYHPTDEQIIHNLKLQGYSQPKERGKEGYHCLFYSALPDIISSDANPEVDLKYLEHFDNWKSLKKIERGQHLRTAALQNEQEFINEIKERSLKFNQMSDKEKHRIIELYKDMQQVLEENPFAECKKGFTDYKNFRKYPPGHFTIEYLTVSQLKYCMNKFTQYQKETSKQHSFAGTSEAIALALIFKRNLNIFGGYTLLPIPIENGNIRPFFTYAPDEVTKDAPSIVLFQSRKWGGHYQQLIPPSKTYTQYDAKDKHMGQ